MCQVILPIFGIGVGVCIAPRFAPLSSRVKHQVHEGRYRSRVQSRNWKRERCAVRNQIQSNDACSFCSEVPKKRPRGRPPGTGKKDASEKKPRTSVPVVNLEGKVL